MDMQAHAQFMLAYELATQGLSQTAIAAHLGRYRETIGLWRKGIAADGFIGCLTQYAQTKKGPDEPGRSPQRLSG